MKRILHSLHGRIFGTTDRSEILAPGGLLVGDYGSQFAMAAPDRVVNFDDFDGTAILGMWGVNKGSDGATVNFAVNAAQNGTIRATTGAGAGGTMAVNGVQVNGSLNFKASGDQVECNFRVKLSAIANLSCFLGFTNQVAALQAPAIGTGGGNGVTFNANDCVGVLYDSTMTIADWWLVGNAATVNATTQDSLFAPVAATYDTWHISLTAAGVATFFRNGKQVGVAMAGAVTPGTLLAPTITCFTRTAASQTIDADYMYAAGLRV